MPQPTKSYRIVSRYFDAERGWQRVVTEALTTYDSAARQASTRARELDGQYGDDHFWNVYLETPEGEQYFELFHGRTS